MKSKVTASTALTLLFFTSIAFPLQDAVNLKKQPKTGDSITYKFISTIEVMSMEARATGKLSHKVIKVENNGEYVVEATTSDMKISDGAEEKEVPGTIETLTLKPTGEVVQLKGGPSSTLRSAHMSEVVVPDRAVRTGDTWEVKITADDKIGVVAAKATYKVEAAEKVGEFDCLKIKSLYQELDANRDENASTLWLSVKDGSLVKAESVIKQTTSDGVVMKSYLTMTRI